MSSDGGNDQAWQALIGSHVQEHGRLFHRLAYGVLGSADAAADVCQQAFLRAWQCRGNIRDRGTLRAWLARVVINESFHVLRRGQIEQRMLARRVQASVAPADHVDDADRRDLVLVSLAQLPEPIREVVTLRVMQGMSGNEVGQLLGLSIWQVSRYLHEGLDRLRTCLGDGR